MGLVENIHRMLCDTMEDLGIPYKISNDNRCIYSEPVTFQDKKSGNSATVVLSFQLMQSGFYCQVFCADYLSDRSNEKETIYFLGLLNQYLATPGTQLVCLFEGAIAARRFVDCINTLDAPPSSDKIIANINVSLYNYMFFKDYIIMVDQKKISAQDMFSNLIRQ